MDIENRTIIVNYLIHILSLNDKVFASRVDLFNGWLGRNEVFIKLFKARHGITTECELKEWVSEAVRYIFDIRKDMLFRLNDKSLEELRQIMNNESVKDEFIEKYKMGEGSLENDRFFQCG
jgi:hypothetical protein